MLPNHLPNPQLHRAGTGEPALRWGVIGPGWIAGEFVGAAHRHTAQRFVAVASRSRSRAQAFASRHGIDTVVDSVDALVTRKDVDAVYVATPHSDHLASGLAAIAAGKHVLIEKPIALNADEAQMLADAGRAAGVLVMEAMWTRYLPQTSVIRQLLADGVFGDIHSVQADHGQRIAVDPSHRLYRPDLGGGALLDLGIYPVQFASFALGAPKRVTAIGSMTNSGVDAQSTLLLEHDGDAISTLTTTMLARTPMTASISGSEATLELAPVFYAPTTFSLSASEFGGPTLPWEDTTGLKLFDGLSWEANAFARYVGERRVESPVHTLEETVSILATIDQARTQLPTPVATV